MDQQLLDLVSTDPAQRVQTAVRAFDALSPGDAITITGADDLKPLLAELQSARAGAFEWNVLAHGEHGARVELCRRTTPGLRTVTEYLEHDHRRLDGIMAEVNALISSGDFGGAGRRFADFATGLNRHIEAEETVLFPDFEQRTGETRGPTAVMRAEHIEIRRSLVEIGAAIDAQDTSEFRRTVGRLVGVLSQHNFKEERILYPMSDQLAGGTTAPDRLVQRMQAI